MSFQISFLAEFLFAIPEITLIRSFTGLKVTLKPTCLRSWIRNLLFLGNDFPHSAQTKALGRLELAGWVEVVDLKLDTNSQLGANFNRNVGEGLS